VARGQLLKVIVAPRHGRPHRTTGDARSPARQSYAAARPKGSWQTIQCPPGRQRTPTRHRHMVQAGGRPAWRRQRLTAAPELFAHLHPACGNSPHRSRHIHLPPAQPLHLAGWRAGQDCKAQRRGAHASELAQLRHAVRHLLPSQRGVTRLPLAFCRAATRASASPTTGRVPGPMSRLLPATVSRNNSHAPVPAAWPGFTSVRTAPRRRR